MQSYHFTLTGKTSLIMHQDSIDWTDFIDEWRANPSNKPYLTKAKGDDRAPGFVWFGFLYHDGTHIAIPTDNLMRALRDGAAKISKGSGKETFKRQSQSGMGIQPHALLLYGANQQPIPIAPFQALADRQERAFMVHRQAARDHGFDIFAKRARIGKAKHIRARPIFHQWTVSGTVTVWDDTITPVVVRQMFELTGTLVGLCDWRPAAPEAPGHYGLFDVTLEAA